MMVNDGYHVEIESLKFRKKKKKHGKNGSSANVLSRGSLKKILDSQVPSQVKGQKIWCSLKIP
jgi:hypothetical protein